MYVYFAPRGGFNDILSNIKNTINYCIKTNRTLLVDTTKCCYCINFSDYFYFKYIPIAVIRDINIIRKVIADESLTIYPNSITDRNVDKWELVWTPTRIYTLNGIPLELPSESCEEKIIIYSTCGGGNGIELFKNLYFKQNIIDHVKEEFTKLPSKYLAIQIRNTDIKCDYKLLYNENMELIHSYDTIYVATDDPESLQFFREQGLNIVNFTEFPINFKYNLHYSMISGDTKIKNLISDMYIINMADKLLSNSRGGFIVLLRNLRNNVSVMASKIT
jgi:hypothetical protein